LSSKREGGEIRLVAIDLDGTLLTPEGEVTARNEQAIRAACAKGISVVLATGKSRASARHIVQRLDLHMPGVFTQGTTIYDGEGALWHETTIGEETAAGVLRYAEAHGLGYTAYAGERILMPFDSPFRWKMFARYDEPLPEVVGSLLPHVDELAFNKIVVLDANDDGTTRQALYAGFDERVAGSDGGAHVTQAVESLIEVLPAGASKGVGLQWLLAELGIDAAQVLAIGDGENDIEMVSMVGYGVAMANAHPRLKAVALWETANNQESGVAKAIERFVLNS
jgi:Cof subfamily protein (haloacid dehalogenase superfamily)